MPKGVMWHHDQMRKAQLEAQKLLAPVPQTLEEHVALITSQGPGNRTLPSCPMMHGTGFITAIGTLMSGGALVTLADPSFDATELWETVDKQKVRTAEHTSELQSLMRSTYAVLVWNKKQDNTMQRED